MPHRLRHNAIFLRHNAIFRCMYCIGQLIVNWQRITNFAVSSHYPIPRLMYTPSHRRRSAWLLLAVFVPMLLFSSLHHHAEPSQVACSECVQHLTHAGHLSAASIGWDHCLLCQLLTLTFLPGLVRMMLAEERSISKPMGALRHLLQKRFACCAIPRAPPCLN